ncbi:MAG: Na(+)-translocating NADH-quinone reductase subunit C [Candidatus Binatia bacterium]
MKRDSITYTFAFAGTVCVVCAVLVSTAAVTMRERQRVNVELDRRQNVLLAAGVLDQDESASREVIQERFASFEVVAIDLEAGQEVPDFNTTGYDPRRAAASDDASRTAPPNQAGVRRLPKHALVYRKSDSDGRLQLLVLPVHGMGLWSTMYGFLALGPDLSTIRGLTYYEHGETPGLGAEVDNPRWKQLWPGRVAFDEDGNPAIEVIRGRAGDVKNDPHRVDGISGATITGRGVTWMLQFWLGEQGYGPYLERLRRDTPKGGGGNAGSGRGHSSGEVGHG